MNSYIRMNMSEEQVFAQELSDEELAMISGGAGERISDCSQGASWDRYHCVNLESRNIFEGGFPNCASTVEDGSLCSSNDACVYDEVRYDNMRACLVAWR